MDDYIQLSPSQMKSTCTCPLQQYYKRVLKWDDPTNFNLLTGNVNHSIGEESQKLKCLGVAPWDEEKTHQRVEHWFNYHIAKAFEGGGVRLSNKEIEKGVKEKDTDWDSLCDHYLKKSKEYGFIYVNEVLPDVFPMRDENEKPMIEHHVELQYHFSDGLKVKVTGYIDTVDEREIIIDLKNIGQKPSDSEVREAVQYKVYGTWYKHHYGHYPKIRQDTIIKVKEPYYKAVEGFICEEDEEILKRHVHSVAMQKMSGITHPAGTTYMCSEDMCAYYPSVESIKKEQFCNMHYAKTNL
jgi:hypothetical protein